MQATTIVTEFEGRPYRVTVTPYARDRGERAVSRTRVFVGGHPQPEDTETHHVGAPGYGSIRGDDSEQDKQWRRYNRAELAIMRHFLAAAQPALVGVAAEPTKLSFSRTAGCICPCSPGFKADRYLGVDNVSLRVEAV